VWIQSENAAVSEGIRQLNCFHLNSLNEESGKCTDFALFGDGLSSSTLATLLCILRASLAPLISEVLCER
jgi:hypothetical protein